MGYSAFGTALSAAMGLLTGAYHLSKGEVVRFCRDFFGIRISVGSVIGLEREVSRSIQGAHEEIGAKARGSPLVKHLDETSWRDSGKRRYAWLLTTAQEAYFRIFPGRKYDHARDLVGSDFEGRMVTDRQGAYLKLDQPHHQFCLAHLLREAERISEHPRSRTAGELKRLLSEVLYMDRQFRDAKITQSSWSSRIAYRRRRLEKYLYWGKSSDVSREKRFCKGVWERFDWLWVFTRYTDMEPTNNLAERDIRPLVLWRKKSYGTRSTLGQLYVERITSLVSTLNKRKQDCLSYLLNAVQAHRLGAAAPAVPTT